MDGIHQLSKVDGRYVTITENNQGHINSIWPPLEVYRRYPTGTRDISTVFGRH